MPFFRNTNLHFMTLGTKILQDPPFFRPKTPELLWLPSCSVHGRASDSCQGPNDEKTRQGNCDGLRQPVELGRAGVDREHGWDLIRHQRSVLRFGLGRN